MAFVCPKCKAEYYDRVKYCPECGFDFTAGQKRCPKCHQQVPIDSLTCPECGLDFERYAFFVPRLVVFSSLALLVFLIAIFPWIWKASPFLHDKGTIVEGQLRSDIEGQSLVPSFIHWKSGERYIDQSREASGYGGQTDYMNNLVPLPPEVIFHYDIPVGEKVWIIRRTGGSDAHEWLQVGRWTDGHDKYGWVHATNIRPEE